MASIGAQTGFFWQTLWDLPDNADLKNLRKDPNVLMQGDQVVIPDLRKKQESRSDGARYKFKKKGVPEKLRIKLLDADKKPRANMAYTLYIDGVPQTGTTSATGEINVSIPPDAQQGKLVLDADKDNPYFLNLGHLNPTSTVSGAKSRLANLGYYSGPLDENWDDSATAAMNSFQKDNNLPVTNELDDATRSKLQDKHGH